MKAWTYVYNPFILGGSVNQPTGFEFEDEERVELGKGYYGYVLSSPSGHTIVVEEKSGAIVGSLLESVRSDIAEASEELMKQQVAAACKENVRIISPEEFWRIYEK